MRKSKSRSDRNPTNAHGQRKGNCTKVSKADRVIQRILLQERNRQEEMDRALEQEVGLIDPKRYIGDIVLKTDPITGTANPGNETRKKRNWKREYQITKSVE